MSRRTLDYLLSAGGFALSVLLVVLAVVMTSNANFAKSYVKDQLSQQNISFKPAAALTPDEAKSSCLVNYAGEKLTTGEQAECYANDFIGLHVRSIADGATYAELGETQSELREQVAAATAAGDPDLPALQKQLDAVDAQRESLFKGETLRGLLLTSYGFSVFGVKGGEVAVIAFVLAGLLAVLSAAGLAHARRTPGNEAFAPPALHPRASEERLVGA